jgi:hypothetical protein
VEPQGASGSEPSNTTTRELTVRKSRRLLSYYSMLCLSLQAPCRLGSLRLVDQRLRNVRACAWATHNFYVHALLMPT